MADVERRDESILSFVDRKNLEQTLSILEEYYPEHKTYAMNALCGETRKKCNAFADMLGYNSTDEFLLAYGYEPIKGSEVYELRKQHKCEPGNEPELIKEKVYNTIKSLNKYYPTHVIEGAITRNYSKLAEKITGLYQWLGYASAEEMLAAYGFQYNAKPGRKKTVDAEAIIDELRKRYPDGAEMSLPELKAANPDLSLKRVQNISTALFGLPFTQYLQSQGILRKVPAKPRMVKTEEELAAARAIREEKKKEIEYQRAVDDLAAYDSFYLNEYSGWKVLPFSSYLLFQDNNAKKSKARISNIIRQFGMDADQHFRNLGVVKKEGTKNDLRELIQNISFSTLLVESGFRWPDFTNVPNEEPMETAPSVQPAYDTFEQNIETVKQPAKSTFANEPKTLNYLQEVLEFLEEKYSHEERPTNYGNLEKENPEIEWNEVRYLVVNEYDKTASQFFKEKGFVVGRR